MELHRHVIAGHGLTATFTEWGASLIDLRLDGVEHPLVLGLERLQDYAAGHAQYMGATAGRMANRVGGARFSLDGTEHRTDVNFRGRHTLHGGAAGTGKRVWTLADKGRESVAFSLLLADGEMGFPGAMEVTARFACEAGTLLRVEYRATCEAVTLCNLAHHSYWNLDGSSDINGHSLTVRADRYLPVDDDLIPIGVAPVDGTAFDFRAGRALPGEHLLDHNLCLSDARVALRDVAVLRARGLMMTLATTEPGLQVYDGALVNTPVPGLDGRTYRAHAGVALEPQVWPDAPNHEGFPSAVLRPGETYRQTTTYRFSRG